MMVPKASRHTTELITQIAISYGNFCNTAQLVLYRPKIVVVKPLKNIIDIYVSSYKTVLKKILTI